MSDIDGAFWLAVKAATSYRAEGQVRIGPDEYNRAAAHAIGLVQEAGAAYSRGSIRTAVFLAITALEETAKAELLGFRNSEPAVEAKGKGRDPLLSHKAKHVLAVRPTVFMGRRLSEAIGADRCLALQEAAVSGDLVELREQALYVSFGSGGISTPAETITAATAREVLLLAIEAADDILIGWTNMSFTWSEPLDALFAEIAGSRS